MGDQWLFVKTGPAAVLLNPSSSSIVVATITVGTRVQARRLEGGWYLVLVPKAANERAPVSGWVPATMLSAVKADVATVPETAYVEPPAQIAVAAAPSQASDVAGLLNDLRSQRDRVEAAIRALDGLADAQALLVKRDKLDRAIQSTEALAERVPVATKEASRTPVAVVGSQPPPRGADAVGASEQVKTPVLSPQREVGPRFQTREGFWFNAGLGVGSSGCDYCGGARETGLSGGLSLGATVSDRLLLGVGTTGWAKKFGDETVTIGTLDARLRFYPARTSGFFLTGGLGLGSISFAGESEVGVGVVLGLGWDIRIGSNVSLTPFWNGFAMRSSLADANVGQLGISFTIH